MKVASNSDFDVDEESSPAADFLEEAVPGVRRTRRHSTLSYG
jgi:hypothetical protein